MITYVFTTLTLHEHITLYSNLYRNFALEWLNRQLKDSGIADTLSRFASTLSFGERIKFEVALTLACRPRLLLLDEPTVGLDLLAIDEMRKLTRTYVREQQATAILTSHNLDDISELSDRGAFLRNGSLVDTFNGNETTTSELSATYRRLFS